MCNLTLALVMALSPTSLKAPPQSGFWGRFAKSRPRMGELAVADLRFDTSPPEIGVNYASQAKRRGR